MLATFGGIVPTTACRAQTADQHLDFYGVALDDSRFADLVLQRFLKDRIPELRFSQEQFDYERVIDELVRPGPDRPFLARTTPYVFVVAKTLGAKLDILATYRSRAAEGTTYHSYFVVGRQDLERVTGGGRPGPDELELYLRQKASDGDPAEFVYHNRFSTSSYFIPSLYFRDAGIYAMEAATENLIPIRDRKMDGGSTDLVRAVAAGDADLAAVWDGTMKKFELGGDLEEIGSKVVFIRLDTRIPNDLLVASENLDPDLREKIRQEIAGMTEEDLTSFVTAEEAAQGKTLGDFVYWLDFNATSATRQGEARKARAALSRLCMLPQQRPAPVVVQVEMEGKEDEQILSAAEQALRLSGTELVIFDPEIHDHADVRWILKRIHHEAVELESTAQGLEPQTFRISFQVQPGSQEDLTQRIGDLIHSRMHRIRYLWPFQTRPTVIRDVAFSLPEKTVVRIERIHWLDPESNRFERGKVYQAEISESDYSKFRLEVRDAGQDLADSLDPLSNVAYRVILVRPSEESRLLKVFTVIYVLLMAAAAVLAAVDWRRRAVAR